MKKTICLGIESTAHTFGCGIIDGKGRIYANVADAYKTEKGGIHPSEAKLHHENAKDKVVEDALKIANLKLEDIDLVSFSQGPGLSPCLLVGIKKAKELAKAFHATLMSSRMTEIDAEYPIGPSGEWLLDLADNTVKDNLTEHRLK